VCYLLVPFKTILHSVDMIHKHVFLSGMSDTASTKHLESRMEIIPGQNICIIPLWAEVSLAGKIDPG
jgi:hypothetical protein